MEPGDAPETMRIERLEVGNFRAFKHAVFDDLPPLCVLVGANGTGKSTVFEALRFLQTALRTNVDAALDPSGGLNAVRTRGEDSGPSLKVTFGKPSGGTRLRYELEAGLNETNEPGVVVVSEDLSRVQEDGAAIRLFDRIVRGHVVVETPDGPAEDCGDDFYMRSNGELALSTLGSITAHAEAGRVAATIDGWSFIDLRSHAMRPVRSRNRDQHLEEDGGNLGNAIDFLHLHHPKAFARIVATLCQRVPGLGEVKVKVTEDERILLSFRDHAFERPFTAANVSDGTMKMLAYLTLLHNPRPHPLLCVEEPEHHLYPDLLGELTEEFRLYAHRGGQVVVTTHSPEFLNALEPDEVFWLVKREGHTQVRRVSDDEQLMALHEAGTPLGALWRQGHFEGAHPE